MTQILRYPFGHPFYIKTLVFWTNQPAVHHGITLSLWNLNVLTLYSLQNMRAIQDSKVINK
jgi:hypothetical protein